MADKFERAPNPDEVEPEELEKAGTKTPEEYAQDLIESLGKTPAGKYMEGGLTPDTAELHRLHPDYEREQIEVAQKERRPELEMIARNLEADHVGDERIKKFWQGVERMEGAERERGKLFSDYTSFFAWEGMSNPGDDFEPGIDSGFEQGQIVTVERTSGELENGWTFMGIRKDNNLAVVRKDISDPMGQVGRFKKEYPLDRLKSLNQRR